MNAIYDLCKQPTTFDFASWACYAKTCGATSVHFIVDGPIAQWKYGPDIAWKRWANILIPLCRLARLEYTVGERKEGKNFPYLAGHLNRLYKQIGRIEKLKPTQVSAKSGYVTITMRDSFRNKFRNSNVDAWEKFRKYLEAKNFDVEVFQDCENAPLNLEYRMGMYWNAYTNMGSSNGPLALCLFSEAPYLTLNQLPDPKGEKVMYDQRKLMEQQGFPEGSQYAFRNERQLLVYEPDDFENIVRAWEGLQARTQVAA